MTMFYTLAGCADIPCPVFKIVHIIKLLIEFVVPVVLIILGMLDFAKATMAHDDNGIIEAKNTFIRRLIAACTVFFVVVIFELVFNIIADSADNAGSGQDGRSVWTCVSQMLDGDESSCDNTPFTNEPVTPAPGGGEN